MPSQLQAENTAEARDFFEQIWGSIRNPYSAPEWVSEANAAELLALPESTLKTMRCGGRLIRGDHWDDASANVRGPVTLCIPKIRDIKRRLTI